ncbi:hypothetical protein [Paenibacillus sp. NPDC058174]|uniref:hypothetical protein n=1 Tax=Paenibacillus sp. NPDC058174 TaxID=3346366 RepID=UPI0036DE30A6
MNFLLNERMLLEEALKLRKIKDEKPTHTFQVLIKHFFKEGLNKTEVLLELEKFLQGNYKYNFVRLESLLRKMINSIHKNYMEIADDYKYRLNEITQLSIPKRELDVITALKKTNGEEDLELQKFAFSILVTARLKNLLRVNEEKLDLFDDHREIIKDAQLSNEVKTRKKRMLFELKEKGLIEVPLKITSTKCKALFITNDTDKEITITDFNNSILYFLKWKGEKGIIDCAKCNAIVRRKTNNQKYCRNCSVDADRELARNRMKTNRILSSIQK